MLHSFTLTLISQAPGVKHPVLIHAPLSSFLEKRPRLTRSHCVYFAVSIDKRTLMPCLELKIATQPHSEPATRLRALLEKPGAAVLRRNHVADGSAHDELLRSRIRVAAVLAVNLSDPPREPESSAPSTSTPAPSTPAASSDPEAGAPAPEPSDALANSFAKGLEIWVSDEDRAARILVDADEIPGVLAMFDAYLRLARFQPAFQRLDQRLVGLHYAFREGLSIGIQGDPAQNPPNPDAPFESMAAIPPINDFRDTRLILRLPNPSLGFFHDLLRSASAWLDENSYPNILGTK